MHKYGEVSEWFKELVLKTSDTARYRGFESHPLRHETKVSLIQGTLFLRFNPANWQNRYNCCSLRKQPILRCRSIVGPWSLKPQTSGQNRPPLPNKSSQRYQFNLKLQNTPSIGLDIKFKRRDLGANPCKYELLLPNHSILVVSLATAEIVQADIVEDYSTV